ncbi:MAG: hypothetical protein NC906_00715 [Candidatus Omnitrophica bacterium]|nr:hypothetical protein [Candidatus Omnitrophota bacterium]
MKKKSKNLSRKKSGKKWGIFVLIVLLIIAAGAYIGYTKYVAYQKYLAEQRAKEEEMRKKQLAEEQKRKELEQAKKMFAELIERMKDALLKKDYKLLKELASKARELAAKYNFPVDEIDRILKQMELQIAMTMLEKLERITDPYAHIYIRNQLKKIPRYPEIAQRWDRLMRKTFQDEYTVLLDLAEQTAKKVESGENPEANYVLSKTYLKKANLIVNSGKAQHNTDRVNLVLQLQSQSYLSGVGKSFQPGSLYR